MKPLALLFICFGFIVWLFRHDMRTRGYSSLALLVPGFWLAMIGSRPIDYWLGINSGTTNIGGNPVNMAGFLVPEAAAFVILAHRGFSWGTFIARNRAILLLYFFFLASVIWSPFPLPSLKRLLKDFGCIPVALVILTDANPAEAAKLVFVRVAYVLFPLSVVFIKYFPTIGRNASMKGNAMFTGVASHKNGLGELLCVLGLAIMWDYLEVQRMEESPARKIRLRILQLMFLIGGWLLYMSHCVTAAVCVVLSVAAFWACRRLVNMRRGRKYLVIGLLSSVLIVAVDQSLGFTEAIVEALGRNMTLTGRTQIWHGVLDRAGNPLTGIGFDAFWDTSRAPDLFEEFSMNHIKSAHNGYLETFLDGGFIAVALLAIVLVAAAKNAMDKLFSGTGFGRAAFVFWFLAIIHNMSESDYFRTDPVWFSLLLFSLDHPIAFQPQEASAAVDGDEAAAHSAGATSSA